MASLPLQSRLIPGAHGDAAHAASAGGAMRAPSSSSFGLQYLAMLWKTILLKVYAPIATIIELLLPGVFFILLVMGYFLAGGLGNVAPESYTTATNYLVGTTSRHSPDTGVYAVTCVIPAANGTIHPAFADFPQCKYEVKNPFNDSYTGAWGCMDMVRYLMVPGQRDFNTSLLLNPATSPFMNSSCELSSVYGLAIGVGDFLPDPMPFFSNLTLMLMELTALQCVPSPLGYFDPSPEVLLDIDRYFVASEMQRTFFNRIGIFAAQSPTASLTRYGGLLVSGSTPDLIAELWNDMNVSHATWSRITVIPGNMSNSSETGLWWKPGREYAPPLPPSDQYGFPGFENAMWFPNSKNALAYIDVAEGLVVGLIEIVSLDTTPTNASINFAIRLNYSATPATSDIRSQLAKGNTTDYCQYTASGFLAIQQAISASFTRIVGAKANGSAIAANGVVPEDPVIVAGQMPIAGYYSSDFLNFAADMLPLLMVFAFLYSVSQSVGALVMEKEIGIREAAFIMGLRRGVFYVTYITASIVMSGLSCLIGAGVMKIILKNTEFFSLFLVIFLYGLAISAFAFFISVFFSKARMAAIAGPLLMFVVSIPYFALQGVNVTGFAKFLLYLLPASPFAAGMGVFFNLEANALPSSLASFGDDDNWLILPMFILDILIYFLLGWYLDHVLPSAVGVREKPWFLFTPSYWCPSCVNSSRKSRNSSRSVVLGTIRPGSAGPAAASSVDAGYMEALTAEQEERVRVRIDGLTKEFKTPNGRLRAVDGLSMSLPEGDITVLLGHNGAGKTTTVNMLTGILGVSGGDATVYGASIVDQMSKVRKSVGLCPQRNVLWPALSVRQHLEFYASIKGIPWRERAEAVESMIRMVKLLDKASTPAKALSGGQKRKLSVGIALIGGSRVVFLDEPTAGMDVQARRATWEILQAAKPGRVIVLTTHYMDEAEILGSQIAIMNRGRLHAFGSPLFLKSRLGVGYNLSITMADVAVVRDEKKAGPLPPDTAGVVAAPFVMGVATEAAAAAAAAHHAVVAAKDRVKGEVFRRIEDAETVTDVGLELTLRLPMRSTAAFPSLFRHLDENVGAYGIRSYGVSVTTLEEIFIRIATSDEGERVNVDDEAHRIEGSTAAVATAGAATLPAKYLPPGETPGADALAPGHTHQLATPTGTGGAGAASADGAFVCAEVGNGIGGGEPAGQWDAGVVRQFGALVVKRAHCARRDRKTICCMVVLPVVFIALAFLFSLFGPPTLPNLVLVPNVKQPSVIPLGGLTGGDVKYANTYGSPATFGVTYQDSGAQTSVGLATYTNDTYFQHGKLWRDFGLVLNDSVPIDETSSTAVPATVLHNVSAFHALPIGVAAVANARFNATLAGYGIVISPTAPAAITVSNHPLPLGPYERGFIDSLKLVFTAIFVLIPFTFIPANFVAFVVKEREVKAKHLQLVSGVRLLAYWASTYAFDMILFALTVVLSIVLFIIFALLGVDFASAFVDSASTGFATLILLMLYGLSVAPMVYSLSFAFEKHNVAQNVTMLVGFVLGFVCVMAVNILKAVPSTKSVGSGLAWLFRLFPPYCLGEGLINIANRKLIKTLLAQNRSPFDFDNGIGRPSVFMVGLAVVFFIVLALLEGNVFAHIASKLKQLRRSCQRSGASQPLTLPLEATAAQFAPRADEDDDVAAERVAVEVEGGRPGDRMYVQRLVKVYPAVRVGLPPKVAVRGVSFGVRTDEVFAFLGTNGAGKTTTLSVLSGEFQPTSGRGFIDGYDVVLERSLARRNLGYCPQFDAVLDQMTPTEHLWLFGRLRGMPASRIGPEAERLVDAVGLRPHVHKPASTLSGGNKRKLSIAIALMGAPAVIFLDEPSAGLDPVARRTLWDALGTLTAGCSVVLTTHHLEEVEALAHRVGIMVDGEMVCLGSLTHLKGKFGAGYELQVRCDAEEKVRGAVAAIESAFRGARVVEENGLRRTFEIPRDSTTLGAAFELVERLKTERVNDDGTFRRRRGSGKDEEEGGQITDYCLGQTSLEQVFLRVSARTIEQEAEEAIAADRGEERAETVAAAATPGAEYGYGSIGGDALGTARRTFTSSFGGNPPAGGGAGGAGGDDAV